METIDFIEVPHLQEISNFLPVNPEDEEDVIGYIQNISNLIAVNYRYEQYQFAYFGIHLLYMTYIYSTAWKVSQMEPNRYKDAIVFARSYKGRDNELNIVDADSIFNFSLMPEGDISKLFRIIGLDNSQIVAVSNLVDSRNEMAHATGKIQLLTEDSFEVKTTSIYHSIRNIHKSMETLIREWYSQELIRFCKGEYSDYDEARDFILEHMIQSFKLSINELLICNNMSVKKLISEHRDFEESLKSFKKELSDYCKEAGYIQD